jgi:hypothetical protein
MKMLIGALSTAVLAEYENVLLGDRRQTLRLC